MYGGILKFLVAALGLEPKSDGTSKLTQELLPENLGVVFATSMAAQEEFLRW